MSRPRVSVVVPAYQGAELIGPTVLGLARILTDLGRSFELIVVDDGSSDATAAVAGEALASAGIAGEVLTGEPNGGKGHALRRGMLAARGDFLLFTDQDLPFAPECFAAALERLDAGDDVVIGDRHLAGSDGGVPRGLMRRLASRVFTFLVSRAALPGFRDTQAGFKGFRRVAARRLFVTSRLEGFTIDLEVLRLAVRAGMRIGRVPVRLLHDEVSTLRLLPHSLAMLRDVTGMLLRGHGLGAAPMPAFIALFNRRAFWDAHEVLEEEWQSATEPGERDFLQGVIQVAAAFEQLERGNAGGFASLVEKALPKVKPHGPAHAGLNVSRLVAGVLRCRDAVAGGAEDPMPPRLHPAGV